MNDPYPSHIAIEIDRPALTRCLRARWLLGALWLTPLAAMMGFSTITRTLEGGTPGSIGALLEFILTRTGIGAGIGLLLGLIIYTLFFHHRAARYADSLQVTVEGPFLRIRDHLWLLRDRKVHFRFIIDYTVTQSPLLRWFGMHALQLTTTAAPPRAALTLHGIKDPLKVRDTLADIDRLRERE